MTTRSSVMAFMVAFTVVLVAHLFLFSVPSSSLEKLVVSPPEVVFKDDTCTVYRVMDGHTALYVASAADSVIMDCSVAVN